MSDGFVEFLKPRMRGSNYPAVKGADVEEYTLSLPSLAEQRKIAATLSSVDDAIEKTQAVIDQVQVVKRGLMQELLTHGLPGLHRRFKQTEIGAVPNSWQVCPLGHFVQDGPDNGLYRPQKEYGTGTPILRIDAFENGDRLRSPRLRRVAIDAGEAEKFSVKTGDILVNRVNSLSQTGDTVLMRLSLDESRVTPEFGFLWLSSEQVKAHLGKKAKRAVAQASINQKDVVTIPTPCPPLSEQQEIAELTGSIERRLEAEAEGLTGLARNEVGPHVRDLLTGELRDDSGHRSRMSAEGNRLERASTSSEDPVAIDLLQSLGYTYIAYRPKTSNPGSARASRNRKVLHPDRPPQGFEK